MKPPNRMKRRCRPKKMSVWIFCIQSHNSSKSTKKK